MATREEELVATVERQRRQIDAMRPYLCERACKDRKGITICPYCGGIIKK